MAQIPKLSGGNAVPRPARLFHYQGIGDFDPSAIESRYAEDIEQEIARLDMPDEDKQRIRKNTYDIIQGIKDGTITGRDASGRYLLTGASSRLASTGVNRKRWTGRYRKDDDYYLNNAYGVLNNIMKRVNPYAAPEEKKPEEAKKEEYAFDTGNLNKRLFWDDKFHKDNWDYGNVSPLVTALKAMRDELDAGQSKYSNYADMRQRFDDALAALEDNGATVEDKYAAARLFDLRPYVDKDYDAAPAAEPAGEQAINGSGGKTGGSPSTELPEAEKIQQERSALINRGAHTLDDNGNVNPVVYDPSAKKILFNPDTTQLKPPFIAWEPSLESLQDSANLSSVVKNFDMFTDADKEEIRRLLKEINPMLELSVAMSKKEGGIIKADDGVKIKANEETLEGIRNILGKDYIKAEHEGLSGADITRLVALAPEIGSIVASATGVGSLVSGGLGAVGSLTNFGADWADSTVSMGDAIKNLGINLGMDVVSLIPFGKAVKIPRIAKKLAGIASVVTPILSASGYSEYGKSWKQLKDYKKMSIGDWQNIAKSIEFLTYVSMGARAINVNRRLNKTERPDVVWLKTKNGNEVVTKEFAKSLENAKTGQEQLDIIGNNNITLPTERTHGRIGKKTGRGKVSTSPYYDLRRPIILNNGKSYEFHKWDKWMVRQGKFHGGNKELSPIGMAAKPAVAPATGQAAATPSPGVTPRWATPASVPASQEPVASGTPKSRKAFRSKLRSAGKQRQKAKAQRPPYTGNVSQNGSPSLPFNRRGGLIMKFQNPARTLTGVARKNEGSSWFKDVWSAPGYEDAILKQLDADKNAYKHLNDMQTSHRKMYNSASANGNDFTKNAWTDASVGTYQADYAKLPYGNGIGIANAYKNNRYASAGNTGDNPASGYKPDSHYSLITDDRRVLGRKGDFTDEQLAAWNGKLKSRGLQMALKDDDYYYLAPIEAATPMSAPPIKPSPTANPKPATFDAKIHAPGYGAPKTGDGAIASTTPSEGLKPNWGELLGAGRLAGTILTNNAIARTMRNGLAPLLRDPVLIRRQVAGDLPTRTYMENMASEAERIGARPVTSDASLALGQSLDYNTRAGEYRTKGWLADKEAYDASAKSAQEAAESNVASRVDAANKNRASMLSIRQAKANLEAQRKSANWAQGVAPWLLSHEMKWNENEKLDRELAYNESDWAATQRYKQAVSEARDALDARKKAWLAAEGNDEDGWLSSDAYKEASKDYTKAANTAYDAYRQAGFDARRGTYRYRPFLFFAKSGGHLTFGERAELDHAKDVNRAFINDRRLFHKMIADSQKENNKLILSLSGLSKELIINALKP